MISKGKETGNDTDYLFRQTRETGVKVTRETRTDNQGKVGLC